MTKLPPDRIAAYAANAGFAGEQVKIAVAVALAESGGDPNNHNTTPPDDSYGLWQINMYQGLGPSRRKEFGLASNDQLFDPATNARVAYGIYKRSGWTAWTTYTRGKYKDFLKDAEIGINGVTPDGKPSPPETQGNAIISAVNSFGETLFKTGADIGGIIVALVLVVLGVVLLSHKQVGKVLKTAKVVV